MKKDISKSYVQIQGWMITDLKLSGSELITYALIYGFCQDGQSEYTGSINYLCKWLGSSRPTAIKVLKSLVDKNLIEKNQIIINNVTFNKYKTKQLSKNITSSKESLQGGSKESLQGGSKESLPNNTINNNTSIIKEQPTQIDKFKFLEIWNKARVHFEVAKQSNANMFPYQSINDLKELSSIYTIEDFKDALRGLMKQQGQFAKGFKSNIKHFLQPDHFERYLDAYRNKNFDLYDSEEKKGTKISL